MAEVNLDEVPQQVRDTFNKAEAILKSLDRKRKQKRVVFLMSDHGELFGEQDFIDHRFSLLEPLVHVPLVAIGGGFAH